MSHRLAAGDHLRTLAIADRQRLYWVHLPAGLESAGALPVVLAFHGGASNAQGMRRFCGLDEKADAAGFVAVYPNGTGEKEHLLTWNGGNCCGYAREHQVDDVGFVAALLDDLATVLPIDSRRVFAAGMSNGAMMPYRLAAEMPERIAAIAPVGGPMGLDACHPARPVSVIHFHGTRDDFAPLEGGVGKRSVTGVSHHSIAWTIQQWVAADGCPPTPQSTALLEDDDGLSVVRHVYGPGREGSEVALYVIHGGGHTWPGRLANTYLFGKSARRLIANDLLWDFFQRHARPRGGA